MCVHLFLYFSMEYGKRNFRHKNAHLPIEERDVSSSEKHFYHLHYGISVFVFQSMMSACAGVRELFTRPKAASQPQLVLIPPCVGTSSPDLLFVPPVQLDITRENHDIPRTWPTSGEERWVFFCGVTSRIFQFQERITRNAEYGTLSWTSLPRQGSVATSLARHVQFLALLKDIFCGKKHSSSDSVPCPTFFLSYPP